MWKAEEGYDKPPSNKQSREQLPMLQQDPLQMDLELDTAIIEVTPDTPLLKVGLRVWRASFFEVWLHTLL